MTEFIFNPIYNKKPQGPGKVGDAVTYTLKVLRSVHCEDGVFFVLTDDKTKKVTKTKIPLYESDDNYYTYQMTITYTADGLYWYYFELRNDAGSFYLCKTYLFDVLAMPTPGEAFAQIVYQNESAVDKSYNKGIIYHIFVDRFKKSGTVNCKSGMVLRKDWGGEITKNSRDFLVINQECFGGNLQGIVDKLPYIKSLGTNTIFLSPVFESYSYHKYNVADYDEVDSMFGGWEAFNKLVTEAKKLDMKILLDGVFNHAGSDSKYFNKLARYKTIGAYQSKKSEYYDWFSFENFPDKYECWWKIETLPKFREESASLQQYFTGPGGILAKYMKSGILGFRLDVVDEIFDPYLDKICKRIKQSNPSAMVLGEVWEDAATKIAYEKRRHYFSGNQLDAVMNYPLKNAILDFVKDGRAENIASVFLMLKDEYPRAVQNNLMNFLGTHDTIRILTLLKEHNLDRSFQLLKIASAIQYCSPGVPSVFYGDEVGAEGAEAPFCRVCYPWNNQNKDILAWYKKLGVLRSDKVFVDGECNVLLAHNGVFVFERKNESTRIVVCANCGPDDFQLDIKNPMVNFETGKTVKDSIHLASNNFVILKEGNRYDKT